MKFKIVSLLFTISVVSLSVVAETKVYRHILSTDSGMNIPAYSVGVPVVDEEPDYGDLTEVYRQADLTGKRLCADIKQFGANLSVSTPSGVYVIDFDGNGSGGSVSTYCDMVGEWTLYTDFGTDRPYIASGIKSQESWNYRPDMAIDIVAYPLSGQFRQWFYGGPESGYIYTDFHPNTTMIKFVEINGPQSRFNYINHYVSGQGYQSVPVVKLGVENISTLDAQNTNFSYPIYYYESNGVVYLDAVWIK